MNSVVVILVVVAVLFELLSPLLPTPSLRIVRALNPSTPTLWWQIAFCIPEFVGGIGLVGMAFTPLSIVSRITYGLFGAALVTWSAFIALECMKRLSLRKKLSQRQGPITP